MEFGICLPNFPFGVQPTKENLVGIAQAAEQLNVSHTVIRRLIREGTLPATQVVETTPWIIARESLDLAAVQTAIAAVHTGVDPHWHNNGQNNASARHVFETLITSDTKENGVYVSGESKCVSEDSRTFMKVMEASMKV